MVMSPAYEEKCLTRHRGSLCLQTAQEYLQSGYINCRYQTSWLK